MMTHSTTNINSNFFEKIVSLSLIISPILEIYGWGNLNLSFIIIAVLSIANILIIRNKKNSVPNILWFYFAFWFFSHLITSQSLHFGLIRISLYIILFYSCVKLQFFIKAYRYIACICIIFFFIQEISFHSSGIRIPGIMPFLPIALDVESISDLLIYYTSESERSTSFFSEPAHFAQFLLPLLAIELLAFKQIKWKNVFIIVITLLLTQSGNAIWGLSVIGIAFILRTTYNRAIPLFKRLLVIGAFTMITGVSLYVYANSDMGQKLLQRSETIKMGNDMDHASSGFIRIWRGYYIFEEFDTIYKFIGNGNPDYLTSKINTSYVSVFFDENDRYLNGIQSFLINTGYIGLLIFSIFIFKLWRKTNRCGKTLLAIMIVISCIASTFFNPIMVIPMVIASAMPSHTTLKEYNHKIYQQYET